MFQVFMLTLTIEVLREADLPSRKTYSLIITSFISYYLSQAS